MLLLPLGVVCIPLTRTFSQAFQALQTAYIHLLRNPFYTPDDHDPRRAKGAASLQINSPRFTKEVERIGNAWYPGIISL